MSTFPDQSWPQSKGFTPFTGMEGLPSMFGDSAFGIGSQMLMQGMLSQRMQGMSMSPMGVSDQNLYDRLRQQKFTLQHENFVREMAELDRNNYMRTARGMAALTNTPWGADQQAAARSLAGGIVSASPFLTQLAPDYLDAFGGQRGSSAVMAHYMSLGGKHRIDPASGKMGIENASLKALMGGVYQEMFAGDRYLQEPLSAGRAGALFQELTVRGMMPGAASLEQMQQASPGRMREMFALADINAKDANGRTRGISDLSAAERDRLINTPGMQAEFTSFDSKKVAGTLKDWGRAVEAMREIFGDAGHPNAPMPVLMNAISQLTGGTAMGQLQPAQITDLVRTSYNLAQASGIGMQAATAMTQQAVEQAIGLGLDPVFGARAAQHNMAFISAFQGMGAGAHNAWGRGDMMQQQALNQKLYLQAAASQTANQMATAARLNEMQEFKQGTDAYNFVQAALAGQTEFSMGGKATSLDMEEEDFANMISRSTGGKVAPGQVLYMLEHTAANQEYLFRSPEMQQGARQLQRNEFIGEQSPIAASAAHVFIKQRLGEKFDMDRLEPLLTRLGSDAMNTFMDSSAAVATDRESRNQAIADSLAARVKESADAGDTGAAELLAGLGSREARNTFFNTMAENIYGAVDQELRSADGTTLQNRHVQHNTALMRTSARELARQRIKGMAQEAFAPLGKGGIVRRGMEALMNVDADDPRAAERILSEAIGGVAGRDIAAALNKDDDRLGGVRQMALKMLEQEQAYEAATTPEASAKAFDAFRESQTALQQEMRSIQSHLTQQGLTFGNSVDRRDLGRTIRHVKHTQDQLAAFAAMGAEPADAEGKQAYREAQSRARNAALSHVGNVEDAVAKFLDPNAEALMLRLGVDANDQVQGLRKTQGELQMLAVADFNGDMVAAMSSDRGRELVEKQQKGLAWLYDRVESPEHQYGYLDERGDNKNRNRLRAIASRLKDAKELPNGTLENLLDLNDEQLKKRAKSGELPGGLTEEEISFIQTARGKQEAVRDAYIETLERYQKEGHETLTHSLTAFLGDSSMAEDLASSESGQKLTQFLQGTGMGSMRMRAYLESAAGAAREYHDPNSDLSGEQREALEKKYGVLLDALQSDDLEEGGHVSEEDVMQFLSQKMDQEATNDKQEDPAVKGEGGTRRYEIATLRVYDNGGASLDLGEDPQGP